MKRFPHLPILLVALAGSCAQPSGGFSTHLHPGAKQVREQLACSNPETASISEIALSLPVFESRNIGRFIASGDIQPKISPEKDAWFLQGDGAQRPVMVKRLTPMGKSPVRIKVVTGASPPELPGHATVYELEHVAGGWNVLKAKNGAAASLLVWPMDDSL